MKKIDKKEIEQLLSLIKNEEDRKRLEAFLLMLEKAPESESKLAKSEYSSQYLAIEALGLIYKIILETGKHAVYAEILHGINQLLR